MGGRNWATVLVREDLKNGLFNDIDHQGGWVSCMQKSLFLQALEIVTCHWGRWVSKEDVTISKHTLRVVV